MAHEREVAGLRCGQVLEHLSDYIDNDVAAKLRQQINAHLAECDWCARFGGEFSQTIGMLRQELAPPQPLPVSIAERLAARLRKG